MQNTLLFLALFFMSFLNSQEQQVKINTSKSSVKWMGSQTFKLNKHSGTVDITSGIIKTNGFKIIEGDFIIDMNTIKNTDGKYNEMLVNHLKNEDFFDVEKFPEAKLNITKVITSADYEVDVFANLTIKGITNPIRFKGVISWSGKVVKMTTTFIIDRTLWGITYESKGLFSAVKDDIISDAIEFHVEIVWEQDNC